MGLAGLGLCAAASSLSAANGRPPEVFLPVGISGAVFVTSGYLVARQRPANRIGYLLILIGVAPPILVILRYLFPVTAPLNQSAGVIPALLLAYVLFAFPSGHLTGRIERLPLLAMTIFFTLFAVAVILSLEPPEHGVSRCPPCVPNPLRLTDLSFFPVVSTVGDIGIVASAMVVSALCIRRWFLARGAARRILTPVLFGGLVTAIGFSSTSLVLGAGVPVPGHGTRTHVWCTTTCHGCLTARSLGPVGCRSDEDRLRRDARAVPSHRPDGMVPAG